MAEKPNPVSVEARRLDISILPPNFSLPLTDFLVSQSDDLSSVAGQANSAADSAYKANLSNEEQDLIIAEHTDQISTIDNRLSSAEVKIEDHEARITDNTNRISVTESDISTIQSDVSGVNSRLTSVEGDYISKSKIAPQSLASPLDVTTSYSIGGVKVVGPRDTGWLPSTGAGQKGNMYADYTYTVGATYNQGDVQAIGNGLKEVRQVVKAIQSALSSHGLFD